jgi:hypothetical protein
VIEIEDVVITKLTHRSRWIPQMAVMLMRKTLTSFLKVRVIRANCILRKWKSGIYRIDETPLQIERLSVHLREKL